MSIKIGAIKHRRILFGIMSPLKDEKDHSSYFAFCGNGDVYQNIKGNSIMVAEGKKYSEQEGSIVNITTEIKTGDIKWSVNSNHIIAHKSEHLKDRRNHWVPFIWLINAGDWV